MKLLHLEVEHFGKLNQYSLDLKDGLNVLCRKNGWGKSTLAVFIKAMLYGLPATTKRKLDQNERKKYMPWQGGAYGGSLSFSCEAGSFRIERFFGAKEADDEFRLFDLSTNKPSDRFSANIGVELLGIDAEGFERSTYLSQRSIEIGNNDSITAKLTGLLEDVNDIGSFEFAMESLDRRRKYYEVKGGRGRVPELTQELYRKNTALEECRRMLPEQEAAEQTAASLSKQLQATQEALADLQAQLQQADLLSARREEYERMKARMREAEEKELAVRNSFRNQALPSDTELQEARSLLASYRQTQASERSYQFSESEQESLAALQKAYPSGVPTPAAAAQLEKELHTLRETSALLRATQPLPDSREQLYFQKSGLPQTALLEESRSKLERAEQLEKIATALSQAPLPSPKRRLPLAISILLLLISLAAGAVAIWQPTLQAIALPACLISALLGIATWIFGKPSKGNEQADAAQKKLAALQEEQATLQRFVLGVLGHYGMPQELPSARSALAELQSLALRAREDRTKQEQQQQHIQALRTRYESAKAELQQSLHRMNAPLLPQEPQDALLRIRSDRLEWERLQEKQRIAEEKSKELQARLKTMQDQLSEFFSRLVQRSAKQPEDCLLQMEQLCHRHTDLQQEIAAGKREMNAFVQQHTLDRQTQPPSTAELRRSKAELESKLSALQQKRDENRRRLERLSEKTQALPELEDQVAYLNEELQTAQDNLNTLRRTAEFLEASKEALSTRYLQGMQHYFTDYCKLLQKEDSPAAELDTALEISVRDGGKSRSIESYSQGSRDLLDFCARLALVRSMFPDGELPFLLLDDPFVNLDEEHFTAVRALLDRLAPKLQILYFVCHNGRK